MQFRRIKRKVDGVLLLDKEKGISSNGALQQARRVYQAAKAGHTGNLDPMATGLLPVCFGEATKFSSYLLDADKAYRAVVKLGVVTSTGDAEGEILAQAPVVLDDRALERVLARFRGPIEQVPPMHSALKHQGKALYTYARQGVTIERQARSVTIHGLDLVAATTDTLTLDVRCSKGTYIRVLAEDIGAALGCGAHLIELRRTRSGGFSLDRAYTQAQLEQLSAEERDALLLPIDCLLGDLPAVHLDAESAFYLMRGQAVWVPRLSERGSLRVYGEGGALLGVGEMAPDGKLAPRRLVAD